MPRVAAVSTGSLFTLLAATLSLAGDVAVAEPGAFLANGGQLDGPARYYAIATNSAVYFEPGAVLLDRPPAGERVAGVVLRVTFPAAEGIALPRGIGPTDARTHVLAGDDPSRWRRGLPSFRAVRYQGVAPGADLVYRLAGGRLKYDVEVAAGADLGRVRLRYEGARRLEVARDGRLLVHTAAGILEEDAPFLYQVKAGERVAVRGGYRVIGRDRIGYWAHGHDPSLPLVVDPGLAWSTFLGGNGSDQIYGTTVDGSGNVYIVGATNSTTYPTTPGAYQRTAAGSNDAFVTKLRSDGATILWSTLLGGSGLDEARGLAVDGQGNVFVTGLTTSTDFPTTSGAHRTTFAGGLYDGFVTKLGPNGDRLAFSSFLGGTDTDSPRKVVLDRQGDPVIVGFTASTDFPTTAGVVRPDRSSTFFDLTDGFVTKMAKDGRTLRFSTYLGASGGDDLVFAIALDGDDQITVAGSTRSSDFPVTAGAVQPQYNGLKDGFVTGLNSTASAYRFSTFLGGRQGGDEVTGVTLDGNGNAYVVGRSLSGDFPTTPGAYQRNHGDTNAYDAFVAKLGSTGSSLLYSTLLGGTGEDSGYGICLLDGSRACVVGTTDSNGYPTTSGAYDVASNGGLDAFLTVLAADGSRLDYSTYVGSPGTDAAWDVAPRGSSQVVLGGWSDSGGFPVSSGAAQKSQASPGAPDGFVAVFEVDTAPSVDAGDHEPAFLRLSAPAPNPFLGSTALRFSLDQASPVTVRVLDLRGRVVRTLVDAVLEPGRYSVTWDGSTDRQVRTTPGSYYFLLTVPSGNAVRSVVRLN